MSFYVYILQSEASGKFYIGQTNNIQQRLEYHNKGKSNYTRGKGPWVLIFKTECEIIPATRTKTDSSSLLTQQL